tara:strand:- start:2460 stop:3083 length:624 start_codon:yes stop_codon:yes gene_type:complete
MTWFKIIKVDETNPTQEEVEELQRNLATQEEEELREKAALEKSLEFLNKVIEDADINVNQEPTIYADGIDGDVTITGTSGTEYRYIFGQKPRFSFEIVLNDGDLLKNALQVSIDKNLDNWLPFDHLDVTGDICVSVPGDLPVGDKYASMILGLLNDEASAEKIKSIRSALYDRVDKVIDWDAYIFHLQESSQAYLRTLDDQYIEFME